MESSKGKLTNKKTGESLTFSLNPLEFRLQRSFDFAVEPRLASSQPVIAFRSGGAKQLTFQLRFDKDADRDFKLATVDTFIKSLEKIDDDKRSVPPVEFALGTFVFRGYVNTLGYQALRFDAQANAVSLILDFCLIGSEESESA